MKPDQMLQPGVNTGNEKQTKKVQADKTNADKKETFNSSTYAEPRIVGGYVLVL